MKLNAERKFKELCFRGNEEGSYICWMISTVIVVSVFFLLTLPAMAERKRITLDFADSHMKSRRGEQIAIFLKKELIRQYPGINVSELRLQRVILLATSHQGKGLAQLRVGPNNSHLYQVGRRSAKANGRHKESFSPVTLANPFRQSWGPWQLLLDGEFEVSTVFLEVENRGRPEK